MFRGKPHVFNPGRRQFMGRTALGLSLTLAAPVLAARCGGAALSATEDSAFTKLLLGEGYDLGQVTINIPTEAAASTIVNLPIPINLGKGFAEGLANLQLTARLSTDFADLPIHVTGWEVEVDGQSFSDGKAKTFTSGTDFVEQQVNGGQGTEALIDLPEELNWTGVIWPTTINLTLHVDTSEATAWKDYAVTFNAILQGAE